MTADEPNDSRTWQDAPEVREARGFRECATQLQDAYAENAALRDTLRDERAATNLLLAGLRAEVARHGAVCYPHGSDV